jgi:hypothetical protein
MFSPFFMNYRIFLECSNTTTTPMRRITGNTLRIKTCPGFKLNFGGDPSCGPVGTPNVTGVKVGAAGPIGVGVWTASTKSLVGAI